MKYIGLDIGTKKIGIAMSDEGGTIAFPHSITPFTGSVYKIDILAKRSNVTHIIIGESKNSKGEFNPVEQAIQEIEIGLLERGLKTQRITESFTSLHAGEDGLFNGLEKKRQANERGREKYNKPLDDKAACLILQRFLDKK